MGGTRLEESSEPRGYAFGPFVVDALKRRLWRESRLVPITSKTFDVLVVLLEHRDHVVSKDELLNRVWPSTAVNENNLARQISSLRRVLGQRPDQHDFVVTIPGRGYRFVAGVQNLTEVPSELPTDHEVHLHMLPEPTVDLEAPGNSEEPPSDQPIQGVSTPGSYQRSSTKLRRPRTQLGILVVTTCGVVAIALALAWLRPASPDSQPRRALQRITYDEASLPREASWAPDGQWVVYASDRSGNADLWKHRVGEPDAIRLTTSDANESQPQWSPDGRSIVFRSERDGGGLHIIPATGGIERIVSSFGYGPAWSPRLADSLQAFGRASRSPHALRCGPRR